MESETGCFVSDIMRAVAQTLAALVIKVRELEERYGQSAEARWDYHERVLRFHNIAELYFGGDNLGNLFGRLITAALVRTWEFPLTLNLLAYRLVNPIALDIFTPNHPRIEEQLRVLALTPDIVGCDLDLD